ncbi:hypothetical protein [Pseudomonas sp.]|uniref:hypothetical protein n=1 Tax=Pseudomonas sp. TaxID=306 RepID=UPI0026123D8D|nr:hypothetical protein [Pseudomonas sp.]
MNGLPLTAIQVDGEILSSWLDRTAALHGVQRHHLLKWVNCSHLKGALIDGLLSREDTAAIAWMMRVNETQVAAKTHGWLGAHLYEVTTPHRLRIQCAKCSARLMKAYGETVNIKEWSEAWRIRCSFCGGILTQRGEEQFRQELEWYWYTSILDSADRASAILDEKIRRIVSRASRDGGTQQQHPEQTLSSLFPEYILSQFTHLDATLYRPRPRLASISFSTRLFLLAAAGAQTFEGARRARYLLNVWQENRAVHNRAKKKKHARTANPSLRNNVNLRLRRVQSQINV